jgi:hypothetical protein
VGFTLPVLRRLALETTLRPAGNSNELRVTLVATVTTAHRAPRIKTIPLLVRLVATGGISQSEPVRLYLDGAFAKTLAQAQGIVEISPGVHSVWLESADGTRASLPASIDTAKGREVALTLWAVRKLDGRLRISGDPLLVPRDLSLAGTTIVVRPSGATAVTDADGLFAFPPRALPPDATIGVLADALAPALAAEDPVTIGERTTIELFVHPARTLERVTFPRS